MRENRVVPVDTVEDNPGNEPQNTEAQPPPVPFVARLHQWMSDNVPYYQIAFVTVINITHQDFKNSMIWFLNSASVNITISVSPVLLVLVNGDTHHLFLL